MSGTVRMRGGELPPRGVGDGTRRCPGTHRARIPVLALIPLLLLMLIVASGYAQGESLTPSKEKVPPNKVVQFDAQFDNVSFGSERLATFEVLTPSNTTLVMWTTEVDDVGQTSLGVRIPVNATAGRYSVFVSYWNGTDTWVLNTTFTVPVKPVTPRPPIPIVWVTAGMALVLVGVALSVEFSRYWLITLLLPLFSRMLKDEVLDNKTRYAIHGIVIENPGIHYNAIQREFGLTNGAAAYHLKVLEREDFIRSVRDGRLRRFYSRTMNVPEKKRLTPEEIRDRVLELVVARPGISQRELVMELGIERDTMGYHLRALVSEGRLEARKKGKYTIYYSKRLT